MLQKNKKIIVGRSSKFKMLVGLFPQVAGHEDVVLERIPTLKQRLRLRERYVTPLNELYNTPTPLKKMREFRAELGVHDENVVQEELHTGKVSSELVMVNTTTQFPPGLEDALILNFSP